MTDRIDEYLRGSLGRDDLEPRERNEADAAAEAARQTRAFLAARPVPDLTAAVMRRVSGEAPPVSPRPGILTRIVQLLWTPRDVSVRPAYALLAAGAFAVVVVGAASSFAPDAARVSVTSPGEDPRLFVQFRLQAEASTVQLAGTFTNWMPDYQMHQAAPGVWTITVPLPEGVHDYAFVVDGRQWVADPYAPRIDDGFGGTNSRLTLLRPESSRL